MTSLENPCNIPQFLRYFLFYFTIHIRKKFLQLLSSCFHIFTFHIIYILLLCSLFFLSNFSIYFSYFFFAFSFASHRTCQTNFICLITWMLNACTLRFTFTVSNFVILLVTNYKLMNVSIFWSEAWSYGFFQLWKMFA